MSRFVQSQSSAPRDGAATCWVFTLNNPTDDEIALIKSRSEADDSPFAGIVFQRERGAEGTVHLQGYVQLVDRKRLAQVKTLLCDRVHLEKRRGTHSQAYEYCTKLDTRLEEPYVYGEFTTGGASNRKKRSRKDIMDEAIRVIDSRVHSTWAEVIRDPAMTEALIIKKDWLREVFDSRRGPAPAETSLRPWQQQLWSLLQGPVDSRAVYWYVDPVGNTGKTWLSRFLDSKGALRLENGKSADIAHAYQGQRIVVFDYSRSTAEHINYGVVESLKNGMVFSGKYQSVSKSFEIPHVVCFSNFEPDQSKLSADRWRIVHLSEYGANAAGFVFPEPPAAVAEPVPVAEPVLDVVVAATDPIPVPPVPLLVDEDEDEIEEPTQRAPTPVPTPPVREEPPSKRPRVMNLSCDERGRLRLSRLTQMDDDSDFE